MLDYCSYCYDYKSSTEEYNKVNSKFLEIMSKYNIPGGIKF